MGSLEMSLPVSSSIGLHIVCCVLCLCLRMWYICYVLFALSGLMGPGSLLCYICYVLYAVFGLLRPESLLCMGISPLRLKVSATANLHLCLTRVGPQSCVSNFVPDAFLPRVECSCPAPGGICPGVTGPMGTHPPHVRRCRSQVYGVGNAYPENKMCTYLAGCEHEACYQGTVFPRHRIVESNN